MLTWAFPAVVREEGSTDWLVTFPDLPEAITGGESVETALANASDALEEVVLTYLAEGRVLPDPRPAQAGEVLVVLDAATASRAMLARELALQGVTYEELARRLHKSESAARSLVQGRRRASLPALLDALRSLGRTPALAS